MGDPGLAQRLGPLERGGVDQRLVHDLLGPDPVAGLVPALLGDEPERDVLHVEQDLVLTLTVPHLSAGVPRIAKDRRDGAPGPGDSAAVRVTGGIVGGRGRDAVGGQRFGDRLYALAGQVVGEDPPDHVGGVRVGREDVQSLAISGLGRVGVRPGVDEHVSVRRAPAEEPAFELSLRGHGRPDADLDPVPFPLRHAAEHRHDQVMGFVVGVDRPADLRHPQRHAIVSEQREGIAELVAVERPLRLSHNDRLEPAVRVRECGEQGAGLRPALRRDRAGLVDVEELGDDVPAVRLDQRLGAGELPAAGRFGVLVVLGGYPPPER